jgi:S1-C subfamily serine protease
MRRILAVFATLVPCGAALAGAPLQDRSTLSYSENVTINTACAGARVQGGSAYDSCVARQLGDLQTHPSPDRSGLSAAQSQAIEKACDYYRRTGIAAYNQCVGKAMAGPQQATAAQPGDEIEPNIAKTFVEAVQKQPPATLAAASATAAPLPLPQVLLQKRPSQVDREALTAANLYKKVEKSVFVVLATQSIAEARSRNVAQGSAVAVTEHLLLTNCHVVKDRPLIKIFQDTSSDDATLVAAAPDTDRCVIKAGQMKLVPVGGVAAFDSLAVGERVFAIGAPRSLERTLSEGLISGLRRQHDRNLVQTSAPISPGSSGGGLFDERGNLIGITTLGYMLGAQNLNFAVAAADFWE